MKNLAHKKNNLPKRTKRETKSSVELSLSEENIVSMSIGDTPSAQVSQSESRDTILSMSIDSNASQEALESTKELLEAAIQVSEYSTPQKLEPTIVSADKENGFSQQIGGSQRKRSFQEIDQSLVKDCNAHTIIAIKHGIYYGSPPPASEFEDINVWGLPGFNAQNFVGQNIYLEKMSAIFNNYRKSAAIQQFILPIYGLGGIGKTYLALKFTYSNIDNYKFRIWFDASAFLEEQYMRLAEELDILKDEKTAITKIEKLKKWFAKNPGGLLVYDNAESFRKLNKFLPFNANHHILITSTNANCWTDGLEIGCMEREDAVKLLTQEGNLGELTLEETTAINQLVERLGYLPLALAQAGAYMKVMTVAPSVYLNEYDARAKKERLQYDFLWKNRKEHIPVYLTWDISMESIRAIPAAQELLTLCAYLNPDNIPRHLMNKAIPNLSKDSQGIEILKNYSLIRLSTQFMFIHRVLQDVIREKEIEKGLYKKWIKRVLIFLNTQYQYDRGNKDKIYQVKILIPHMLHLRNIMSNPDETLPEQDDILIGDLLHNMGIYYLDYLHDSKTAELLFCESERYKKNKGKENAPSLAKTYRQLGKALQRNGKFTQAFEYFERYKQIKGEDIDYLCDMANFHLANNKLPKAKTLITVDKGKLGLISASSMSLVKKRKNRTSRMLYSERKNKAQKALGLFYKTLKIIDEDIEKIEGSKNKLPEPHEKSIMKAFVGFLNKVISIIPNHNNNSAGEDNGLDKLYRKKSMTLHYIGRTHYQIGCYSRTWFTIQRAQINLQETESYVRAAAAFKEALALKNKYDAENLREIARTEQAIAQVEYALKNYEEAQKYVEDSLDHKKVAYGTEEYIEILMALRLLANIFKEKKEYDKEKQVLDKIIIIENKIGKTNHIPVDVLMAESYFNQAKRRESVTKLKKFSASHKKPKRAVTLEHIIESTSDITDTYHPSNMDDKSKAKVVNMKKEKRKPEALDEIRESKRLRTQVQKTLGTLNAHSAEAAAKAKEKPNMGQHEKTYLPLRGSPHKLPPNARTALQRPSRGSNAFVARLDKLYKYSEEDIACVIQQYKKLEIFRDAEILDVISNHGNNTPKNRLEQVLYLKKPIFGIFNSRNSHWTVFCILPDTENQTVFLYKDSMGNQPPEALLTGVKEIFENTIIKYHPGCEQRDGTSCGVFALENLRILAYKICRVERIDFIRQFEGITDFCLQSSANDLRKNEFAKKRVLGKYDSLKHAQLDKHRRAQVRHHHRREAERIAEILKNSGFISSEIEIKVLDVDQALPPTRKKIIGIEIFVKPEMVYTDGYHYQYRLRFNNTLEIIDHISDVLGFRGESYQLMRTDANSDRFLIDIDPDWLMHVEKFSAIILTMPDDSKLIYQLLCSNLKISDNPQQKVQVETILEEYLNQNAVTKGGSPDPASDGGITLVPEEIQGIMMQIGINVQNQEKVAAEISHALSIANIDKDNIRKKVNQVFRNLKLNFEASEELQLKNGIITNLSLKMQSVQTKSLRVKDSDRLDRDGGGDPSSGAGSSGSSGDAGARGISGSSKRDPEAGVPSASSPGRSFSGNSREKKQAGEELKTVTEVSHQGSDLLSFSSSVAAQAFLQSSSSSSTTATLTEMPTVSAQQTPGSSSTHLSNNVEQCQASASRKQIDTDISAGPALLYLQTIHTNAGSQTSATPAEKKRSRVPRGRPKAVLKANTESGF